MQTSTAATFHVVARFVTGEVIGVFPEGELSAAQEHARRSQGASRTFIQSVVSTTPPVVGGSISLPSWAREE